MHAKQGAEDREVGFFFNGYNLVIQVKVYVAFTQEFLQEGGHLKA